MKPAEKIARDAFALQQITQHAFEPETTVRLLAQVGWALAERVALLEQRLDVLCRVVEGRKI